MDFFRSLVGDLLTIAGYCALFAGVNKLFQIAMTLGEIKDVLQSQRRLDLMTPVPGIAIKTSNNLPPNAEEDEAAAYAQNLLRAVNAEQQRDATQKTA